MHDDTQQVDRACTESAFVANFDSLFRHASNCVLVSRPDGTVLRANPAACRALGRTEDEIIREGRDGLVVPNASVASLQAERARTGVAVGTLTFRRRDGSTFPGDVTATVSGTEGGAQFGLVVFHDVTDSKRSEEALRKSEALHRSIMATMTDAVVVRDASGSIIASNPAAQRFLRFAPDAYREQVPPAPGWRAIHEDGAPFAPEEHPSAVALQTGQTQSDVVMGFEQPDGKFLWVKGSAAPLHDQTGRVSGVVSTITDVTERKQAERALRESEERYRAVVTNMAEGVIVQDETGNVLTMNPAAEAILGFSAGGHGERPPWDSRWQVIAEDGSPLAREEFPPVATLRTGRSNLNVVVGFRKPDESFAWVKGNSIVLRDPEGKVSGVLSTISDITERRALRERLAVASRLAAMGTLVAGVAHEVNNPLAGAMANTALVGEALLELAATVRSGKQLEADVLARQLEDLVDVLADAQSAARRIASIVRDLALLGRPDAKRTPVRLQTVVQSAVRALPATVASRAAIRVELGEPVDVLASEDQLELAVVNLVTNAALAIPDGQPGVVTIRTGVSHTGLPQLEVADNGSGIEPKVLHRVFDPFFTTRTVGQGMGLGLPICYAIVMAHGGTLTVDSAPGKGSTFRVELPAAG